MAPNSSGHSGMTSLPPPDALRSRAAGSAAPSACSSTACSACLGDARRLSYLFFISRINALPFSPDATSSRAYPRSDSASFRASSSAAALASSSSRFLRSSSAAAAAALASSSSPSAVPAAGDEEAPASPSKVSNGGSSAGLSASSSTSACRLSRTDLGDRGSMKRALSRSNTAIRLSMKPSLAMRARLGLVCAREALARSTLRSHASTRSRDSFDARSSRSSRSCAPV
mmetsp:Transcript_23997/g.77061  ORF Transcript_23997/g.77061 Transcript_23997/m.77061 type:complete len:229 (-) Transcript_23997:1386-2072(-)